MIQEIAPHKYDNQYKHVPPDAESIALYYEGSSVLVRHTGEGIAFPRYGELARVSEAIYEDWVYLFTIDSERYYLVGELDWKALTGYTMEIVGSLRNVEPQYCAFAGITGYQLYNWYCGHLFCGRCGHEMKHDGKQRMLRCRSCGNVEFPKICPAVIIGVTDGDRILMSKYAGRAYKKYALLAGFTEIGETAEETVAREVMEEVGLRVKNIRYYKSQPWGIAGNLSIGYFCDLDGDDTIRIDENELSMAGWYDRHALPAKDDGISLTREMIRIFAEGKEPK